MASLARSAVDESLSVEAREAALLELEDHAGDIDNAHDLMNLGGFEPVVALLASELPPLQAAAAWVVGTSVKNHRELQLHVMGLPTAVPSLLQLARSHADVSVRTKALYALSALLSNCEEAQAAFASSGGAPALLAVLARARLEGAPKLVRKALGLVTDLLREQRAREAAGSGGAVVTAEGEVLPNAAGGDGDGGDGDGGGGGGGGGGGIDVSALLRAEWTNATELCTAVHHCLELDEPDAQEKGVLALDQLLASGLLQDVAGSGDGDEGCSLLGVRTALQSYQKWCDAQVEEDDGGSIGACEAVSALDAKLAFIIGV